MSKIPKSFKLRVVWSEKEQDFMVYYPRSCDGHFIHSAFLSKRIVSLFEDPKEDCYKKLYTEGNRKYFEWDLFKDLKSRGYDLTTFKMEICIDKNRLQDKFDHLWEDLSDKEKEIVLKMGFVPPKENE